MSTLSVAPGGRRIANLDPLTPKQLRDIERDQVYIYNVSNKEHRIDVQKLWVIPACPKGQMVSEALIIPGVFYQSGTKKVDGLHVEYQWNGTDGIDVARDIVGTGPFKDASENLTSMGVFIAAGEEPTDAEIRAATELWHRELGKKIRQADEAYAINNGMVNVNGIAVSNISADAIEACHVLGVDRPYARNEEMKRRCEECGTPNMESAARCRNNDCRAIFDEAKARKRFPEMFQEERRGPGRPPREAA